MRLLLAATWFFLSFSASCAGPGTFVWASQLPPDARGNEQSYVIRDGDVVNVRVFNQEALSTRAKVRSDGRIAMPVLGDVECRGRRPSALKGELEARLKDYVNAPSVTVSVEEFQPITVSVLGEVTKAGSYPLDPRASVAQVLASAGGLTDFANKDRIFVVRVPRATSGGAPPKASATAASPLRVRFTYEELSRGDAPSLGFVLQDGDLVVVE
jgi:polysaccharide export outer membrane protein